MKKFFNINTILILAVLLCGIVGLWYVNANKSSGSKAIVDIRYGGKTERIEIDLSVDDTYHIEAAYPVTLVVKDGKISFQDSKCPDHLCEGFGWLSYDSDFASCLPAGVVVSIDAPGQ